MSPSFLVKILCYAWRPFTVKLASSAIVCAGHCLVLRRILGPKRYESGERRRLQNELHSLYRSPNTAWVIESRRLRWAGHVARMEDVRSAFKILTGKRPRRRWEDNIRMDLEEIGINAGNWVDSAQDRDYRRALVNGALNLRVP